MLQRWGFTCFERLFGLSCILDMLLISNYHEEELLYDCLVWKLDVGYLDLLCVVTVLA